ncbi:hypothetical protein ACKWTF_013639 [Chironomus riparius]
MKSRGLISLIILISITIQSALTQSKLLIELLNELFEEYSKDLRVTSGNFSIFSRADFCRTPGYKMGRCLPIYNCDYLLNILRAKPLTQQTIRFLQMSQCDAGWPVEENIPYVCCARNDDSLILQPTTADAPPQPSALLPKISTQTANFDDYEDENTDDSISFQNSTDLLPNESDCGREYIENRIYSGQNTDREEFPWLALFEYRKFSGEVSINCAGSLISKKYVLTASHCITGDIIARIGMLSNIRLGDYDLREADACNERNCQNPYRFNAIEEVIPHENYNQRAINRRNDIGLVRLRKAVRFSRMVRPICLPAADLPPLKAGNTVYIVGFGRTLAARRSTIKQKLAIPIYDHEICKRKFLSKKVIIHDEQLCAGGEFSKDACDGDSGGPLQRFHNTWIVEGIVSFGYLCGLEDWPAIYTKVSSYRSWIEDHMRP